MKTNKHILLIAACLSLPALLPSPLHAQPVLTQPRASQHATVMQRIGLTDLKVDYHSPLVKGRVIWGELVPYGEVWRCGANENTVFTTSTDITVEGRPLAAGSYGLHMIPTKSDWTVIFSKVDDAWGSFFYDEAHDALRVTVTPRAAAFQEWLGYRFLDPGEAEVTLALHWEKLEVPVSIRVDVHETVYASMQDELHGLAGFFWQPHLTLAQYCVDQGIHADAASAAVDKSIDINANFGNLQLKTEMMAAAGKTREAEQLHALALVKADEVQLNRYGYRLLGKKKIDEAIEVFRMNIERYPDSWNVYDSLGEAFLAKGSRKEALANYKTALSKAPENQHARINDMIGKAEQLRDTSAR